MTSKYYHRKHTLILLQLHQIFLSLSLFLARKSFAYLPLLWETDSVNPWPCWSFFWPRSWALRALCAGLSSFCAVFMLFFMILFSPGWSHVHPAIPKYQLSQMPGLAPALWLEAFKTWLFLCFSLNIYIFNWLGVILFSKNKGWSENMYCFYISCLFVIISSLINELWIFIFYSKQLYCINAL